ncbi:MAG: TetR/AcrR family transcriptional regulator [Peptococcaceae bacterium]|nr:TetR/AcrR family transcriptional regulator [Peptococcaceae bacterium]
MAEKQSKRELILQSARQVFMEKGYHAATSEEIARVAGIGKGTIYQYFASKKDIYDELRIIYLQEYCSGIIEAISLEDSFNENIRRLVHAHVEKIDLLLYIVTSDLHSSSECILESEKMSGIYKTMLESLHRLLVCAGERQELRNVLPELAINYIMSIFMGMAHQTMLYKRNPQLAENFSVEKWEEEIVGLLLHGLSVE